MEAPHIYLFGGIGTEIPLVNLLGLKAYNVTAVKWINPKERENVKEYAKRLLPQIRDERPLLIGISFGGVVAIEVAKQIPIENIILISSIQKRSDLPIWSRLMSVLFMSNTLKLLYGRCHPWLLRGFCHLQTGEDRPVAQALISESEKHFTQWAIEQIVQWKNNEAPEKAIIIHGTHDRIFPLRSASLLVYRGGHFMVLSKAIEVRRLLKKILHLLGVQVISNHAKIKVE